MGALLAAFLLLPVSSILAQAFDPVRDLPAQVREQAVPLGFDRAGWERAVATLQEAALREIDAANAARRTAGLPELPRDVVVSVGGSAVTGRSREAHGRAFGPTTDIDLQVRSDSLVEIARSRGIRGDALGNLYVGQTPGAFPETVHPAEATISESVGGRKVTIRVYGHEGWAASPHGAAVIEVGARGSRVLVRPGFVFEPARTDLAPAVDAHNRGLGWNSLEADGSVRPAGPIGADGQPGQAVVPPRGEVPFGNDPGAAGTDASVLAPAENRAVEEALTREIERLRGEEARLRAEAAASSERAVRNGKTRLAEGYAQAAAGLEGIRARLSLFRDALGRPVPLAALEGALTSVRDGVRPGVRLVLDGIDTSLATPRGRSPGSAPGPVVGSPGGGGFLGIDGEAGSANPRPRVEGPTSAGSEGSVRVEVVEPTNPRESGPVVASELRLQPSELLELAESLRNRARALVAEGTPVALAEGRSLVEAARALRDLSGQGVATATQVRALEAVARLSGTGRRLVETRLEVRAREGIEVRPREIRPPVRGR